MVRWDPGKSAIPAGSRRVAETPPGVLPSVVAGAAFKIYLMRIPPVGVVLCPALEEVFRKRLPYLVNPDTKTLGILRIEVKLPATVSSDPSEKLSAQFRK
jgi:hypothetical protein